MGYYIKYLYRDYFLKNADIFVKTQGNNIFVVGNTRTQYDCWLSNKIKGDKCIIA